MREMLKKTRRKIVVLKFTLSRGYIWCQTIFMATVAAGVLKPYFPMFRFYQLCIGGFLIFLIAGLIDRKLKFLDEEQSYSTERNALLMRGLRGELNGELKK